MKKSTLLFSLFLLVTLTINAQSFDWIDGEETGYQMNPGMIQYTVSTSVDNTVWFTGIKEQHVSYYVMMGDLLLIQYDQEGNRLSEYTITGNLVIHASETDPDGNLYIAGDFIYDDALLWDGTVLSWDGNSINSFLLKIDSQGTVDWALNLNTVTGGYSTASDMLYKNGQLYLSRSAWPNSYLSIVDPDGNLTTIISQELVGIISGFDLDSEGNIYVTGSCSGESSLFNGVNYPSPFTYNKHLVKYDPSGVPVWIRFSEDVTCIFPQVKVDQEDYLYWAGPLYIPCLFDTIQMEGPTWSNDFYLVKFNGQGDALWGREVPQEVSGDANLDNLDFIRILPDNSVVLGATTRGSIDWGNGVVTNVNIGSNEALMINFNNEGVTQWAKTGDGNNYTYIYTIDSDEDGNIYFTGIGHDTTRFDDLWLYRETYYYPYITRLETNLSTSVTERPNAREISVYPNPAADKLTLSVSEDEIDRVEIYDLSGKLLTTTRAAVIQTGTFQAGMYLLHLYLKDGKISTLKFVKE